VPDVDKQDGRLARLLLGRGRVRAARGAARARVERREEVGGVALRVVVRERRGGAREARFAEPRDGGSVGRRSHAVRAERDGEGEDGAGGRSPELPLGVGRLVAEEHGKKLCAAELGLPLATMDTRHGRTEAAIPQLRDEGARKEICCV